MKTSTLLLLAGGVYIAYSVFEAAQFAGTVQVVFLGIDIQSINNIVVKLAVQNITSTSVVVNSMSGTLLLNGDQIATMIDFTPRTVAPNSQTEIDINVVPSVFGILGATVTGENLNFTAQGNVNISGLSTPILPFTLEKSVTM